MPRKTASASQGSLFARAIPPMPEGYSSGDKPNPNLAAFIEAHVRERPYDLATDTIETTKATAIFNMHSSKEIVHD